MSVELVKIETVNALALFTKEESVQLIIDEVKQQVKDFEPDLSTEKGRKKIASFAFKVTQTKTYIEKHGKELATKQKEIPKLIDANRKLIRDELESLATSIRKPLTDWEFAEKIRIDTIQHSIGKINFLPLKQYDHSSNIHDDIERLSKYEIKKESFQEFYEKALESKDKVLMALNKLIDERIEQEDKDDELKRLQEQEEARKRVELAKLQADAEAKRIEKAVANAKKAKEEAIARAEAAEELAKKEKEDAIIKAAQTEQLRQYQAKEAKADAELAEVRRLAQEKLAKAREIEAKRQAAQEKIEAVEQAKRDEAKRIEGEAKLKALQEKQAEDNRIADEDHRNRVHLEIANDIMNKLGCDDDTAECLVHIIAKNDIKHLSILY